MKIYRVVISGAPCSGKTKAINMLYNEYKKKYDVYVCPESASQLINEGFGREDMFVFEQNVFKRQIENENIINKRVCQSTSDTVIVLYDRGIADCYSYVDDVKTFSDIIGISPVKSYSNYDMALILEVCNRNDFENNVQRTETYEKCLNLQDRIINAYMGHPHLRYVKSYVSFHDKLKQIKAEIDFLLEDKEIERKYLIQYPDLKLLSELRPFKAEISQTYLLSSVGSHRIRKRGCDGDFTYFETVKIRISSTSCYENERVISETEYQNLMKNADPDKNTIHKFRYCFLYDGHFFELDLFDFWDDKALLEIELKNIDEEFSIPSFIRIIKDVSCDEHYKNNYLAGMKL